MRKATLTTGRNESREGKLPGPQEGMTAGEESLPGLQEGMTAGEGSLFGLQEGIK